MSLPGRTSRCLSAVARSLNIARPYERGQTSASDFPVYSIGFPPLMQIILFTVNVVGKFFHLALPTRTHADNRQDTFCDYGKLFCPSHVPRPSSLPGIAEVEEISRPSDSDCVSRLAQAGFSKNARPGDPPVPKHSLCTSRRPSRRHLGAHALEEGQLIEVLTRTAARRGFAKPSIQMSSSRY